MSGLFLSGAGKKIFVPIIETALPEQGTLLERNFFPEAGKPLSRNYRDFAGAAWALSRISLMPGVDWLTHAMDTTASWEYKMITTCIYYSCEL